MRGSLFFQTGIFAFSLALAACSAATPDGRPTTPDEATLPGAHGAANKATPTIDKPLPGLESLELEGREKSIFAETIGQLYAPCQAEAVSIRQCIDERRPCTGCTQAARLLGEKIHQGANSEDARRIYAIRFGPTVKQIEVADSPARGPASAPVTIIVWSDFECPHCKHAMPALDAVVEKHPGAVRLVHKFYPLRQHTHATAAARAAIAAMNQGRYWEMERVLFDHQDEQTDTDLAKYAAELRLDMRRFNDDIASDRTTKFLERDHEDAERAGLSGTPFILINGREFEGGLFHVATDLEPWVELELKLAASAKR